MGTVYIFLAEGFEEIEALSVVDILRRAGISAKTVSVAGNNIVAGAHGISVVADQVFEKASFADAAMLVLPGGMPGASGLDAHKGLRELILSFAKANKPLIPAEIQLARVIVIGPTTMRMSGTMMSTVNSGMEKLRTIAGSLASCRSRCDCIHTAKMIGTTEET